MAGIPRSLAIVLLLPLLAAAALSRTPTPADRLAAIEAAYAEGSNRRAADLCREGIDLLEGAERGRCVAVWALASAALRDWEELRLLYEREIDRTPFPHSATLALTHGRRAAEVWGGSEKLRPLERALAAWEGSPGREAEWCETAFALIEGLSRSWEHDIPASEWEKQPQPEDEEERRRAYEAWASARGLEQDEARWARTEELFAGILERSPSSSVRAQALFERGIRRLVAIGAIPNIDVLRSTPVPRLIEELLEEERTRVDGEALRSWQAMTLASIEDWRTIVSELPGEGLSDDAAYLIPYMLELRLAQLVEAVTGYDAFLETYPESQWATNARSRREAIVREALSVGDAVRLTSPGETPVIRIEARNVKTIALSLWRIDRYLDRAEAAESLLPEVGALTTGDPARSWSLETPCTDDHKARTMEIPLPVAEAGAYRLRVEGQESILDLPVFISGVALTLSGGSDEAFAWATDPQTGEPVADAEVLLRLDIRKGEERASWSTRARTDARGLVRWSYPEPFLPRLESGWQLRSLAGVVRRGEEISPAPGLRPSFDSGRRPRLVQYLETDRPVYRPGQVAKYKLTIRQWTGEAHALPEVAEVRLRFFDPQGNPILEETRPLDESGAVSGSVSLPREITLGMCSLRVQANDAEIPGRDWTRAAFRVEEYRRPEFEVVIDPPSDPVLYGDPLTIGVRGSFLSGEPVRGGKVRIRVQRLPFDFDFQPPLPYPWKRSSTPPWWGLEDVHSAEALLDGEGRATFALPTEERGDGRDSRYQVEAWLTDASQREESTTSAFPVTRSALFAHLEPVVRVVSSDEPLEVRVRSLDAMEVPRASTGEIEIARRVDREEEREDGSVVPVTSWEVVSVRPFEVSTESALLRSIAGAEGELRVTYRAVDPRGREFSGSCRLWVVGPEFTGRDYTLEGLQLVTSRAIEEYGGVGRAVILTEREDATLLIVRSAAGRVLSLETVRARGRLAQIEYPIGDAELPNFHLNVWAIWDGEVHRASAEIEVPPKPYFLEGGLAASQDELLPGEEVELSLTLKDHRGRPVEGSWSLALFDRAILAIQPEIHPSPMQALHERSWRYTLRTGHSLQYRSRVLFEWLPGAEPVQRRELRLPDLLRRSWQRRFPYLAASYFPNPEEIRRSARRLGLPPGAAGASLESEILSFSGGEEAGAFGSRAGAPSEAAPMARGKMAADRDGGGGQGGGADLAPVRIRSNFSETAAWEPNFRTDASGRGTLRVTLPDSLTEWRGVARGIDPRGRAFEARVELRTRRNIRLRLAAPRFLREGDQVVLGLIASNQFDEAVSGSVQLDFPPAQLRLLAPGADKAGRWSASVDLPAGGERALELPFEVLRPGSADLVALIATPRESDGLQRSIPVLPYGVERMIGAAGLAADLDGASSDAWDFVVPERSDPDSRRLLVDLTPSPAIALIESLPYLVRYPYGCVEQTLNRFVPAVVVARLLEENGLRLSEILPERAEPIPAGFWGHLAERPLDLFRPEDLGRLLETGRRKLERAQNSDGSWGWWSGYPGDPYMTALVVDHLCTAKEVGVIVDDESGRRAAQWLLRHVIGRDLEGELQIYERPGLEELTWVTRAIQHARRIGWLRAEEEQDGVGDLLDLLHRERGRLGSQGRALLALALHDSDRPGDPERARVVLRNLEDGEGGQQRFGTVHFGRRDALAWYDHGVESTAWALRALLAVTPDDPRIPGVVRWLLENRAGAHYDSTRSTAAVALALSEHLRRTGELACDLEAVVRLDGVEVGRLTIDRETLFRKRGRVEIPAEGLSAGPHRLEFSRRGSGPLHWAAALEFYSREDPIPAGGNRIELRQDAYRLVDRKVEREEEFVIDGRAVIRTVEEWVRDRVPLADGATVAVGDRVLIELSVNSANEFRYMLVESPRPAGLETVSRQSGRVGGTYGYRELRDEKVAWFATRIPEGESTVSIELRAERDGTYRIVPATIEALYLPHVRANSRSGRLSVE